MVYLIYIDGTCKGNPGPAAYAVVVQDEVGTVIDMWGDYIGFATNNVAEYTALIKGLERALELGVREVIVCSDSQLLVRQLNGEYKVKSANLTPLYDKAKALERMFVSVQYRHIPREQNARADSLANEALRIRARYPPIL